MKRRLDENQPESFEFSAEGLEFAKKTIAKYPEGKQASAVISMLWRAQKENGGWLSEPALRCVADMLDMAYIRVYEIATFYTMFNLSPVGENFVQVCGTTPCWLRGSDDVIAACKKHIGPERTVSEDGKFSWMEVECLGACANAPMVQINDDYFEDLDGPEMEKLIVKLRAGEDVEPGSQKGRQFSAPEGELTSLTDPDLYGGEGAK